MVKLKNEIEFIFIHYNTSGLDKTLYICTCPNCKALHYVVILLDVYWHPHYLCMENWECAHLRGNLLGQFRVKNLLNICLMNWLLWWKKTFHPKQVGSFIRAKHG